MKKIIALLCLFMATLSVSAQDEEIILTDRPSQTPATSLLPGGRFQVETGYLYSNTNATFVSHSFNTLARYGVNEFFELRAFVDHQWIRQGLDGANREESSWAPLQLGAKLKVSENKGWIPAMSFVGMVSLRSGENSLESSQSFPDLRMAFSNDLPGIFDTFYSVGIVWSGENYTPLELYTLGLGITLSDNIWSFVELYGYFDSAPVSPSLDAGITWRVSRFIQLDFTGGFDFPSEGRYFLATGANFRL